MAPQSGRFAIVMNAIEHILDRLRALPPSPARDDLQAKAEEYRRDVERWQVSPPSAEERDTLLMGVIDLHIEVGGLKRRDPD